MNETREWLERLYGQSPGYFAVTAFAGGKPRAIKWFSTAELDAAARTIQATSKKADVYVSVATHKEKQTAGKRGGESTVVSIPGFWADLDIGELGHKPASLPNPANETEALSIIDGLPEPSMMMHSGGGLQAFWLFDEPWVFNEPIDKRAAKKASEEWHSLLEHRGKELGFHVDKTHSLDRILRVPGTLNHKADEARPVTAKQISGPTHPVREIASIGIPLDEEPLSSSDSVKDNFPLSWNEILEPHGWTPCGNNDQGVGLWARPGKSCNEGHSATTNPYGVPVMVNFSATDELPSGPGQKLTKLRVWAHLNYDGDLKAARAALKRMVKSGPEEWSKVALRLAESRVNWQKLWSEEQPEINWLIEDILEAGRQIALYSKPKAGKSLLVFEWIWNLVLADPPIDVLYIDKENTLIDLRTRAESMGYAGMVPEKLHYYSFPSLSFLDTEQGGQELYALAKYHDAKLVVIDTVRRVVEGEENDNDTYNEFYKYTGVLLKADGISLIRLDHEGKDSAKGMVGGSSKAADVDAVWHLEWDAESGIVALTRTHTRSPEGSDYIELYRRTNPLRHERTSAEERAAEAAALKEQRFQDALEQLSEMDPAKFDVVMFLTKHEEVIDCEASQNKTWEIVKREAQARKISQEQIKAAQAWRKEHC
jgi:hypothetical protein